jgi:hypothetical protein
METQTTIETKKDDNKGCGALIAFAFTLGILGFIIYTLTQI